MKIGLRYGHSINCRGAEKLISEVDSCRILYSKVKALLEAQGHTVIDCNSNANNVNAELAEGTNKANKAVVDIYVTIHMNSSDKLTARGVECWIYDSNSTKVLPMATRICTNIAQFKIPNRGVKCGGRNYHDLSASNMEAIIVESIFVSNQLDVDIFKNNVERIARAIANGIDSRVRLEVPIPKPTIEMHRNIVIYSTGATADQHSAEFFAMILNAHGEDCVVRDYQEYRKGIVEGNSIFAVGGALDGKFKYHKIFKGKDRNETAQSMLEHLKKY